MTIDSTVIERSVRVAANKIGYRDNKIFIPNIITQGADSVSSVGSITAGSGYTGIPTVSFTGGGGSDAAAFARMKALTSTPVTAQSGAGSYAPGDTFTVTGGTGTAAVLTITNTKVVSATVAAGGSGGTDGTQTVTGTTGTGTKFQASVTIASGAITAVLSITVAGDYTVNPTSLTNEPVTGASLTGAELNVKMGILTAPVSTPGSYSVLPTAPVSGTTSGSGTGATFTLTYGLVAVTVTNGGHDYSSVPNVVFTGGGGTGAAAVAVIAGTDDPITVALEFPTPLPTAEYAVKGTANQACVVSAANKTIDGFDLTLTPLSGETLVAGLADVVVEFTH